MDFWSKTKQHQQITEPPAKRISTPAGQRLSAIFENNDALKQARDAQRASARKSATGGLGDVPRESSEDQNSSGYSYSVWSDGEKFGVLKNHKQIAKRGGWKRLAIIIAIIIAVIIALAVGLTLGLKKKGSNNTSDSQAPPAGASQIAHPDNPDSDNPDSDNPNPTATNLLAPTSTPSTFPLGTYSIITFLDTVQTNCTSNPSTWTCYPYTEYNTSPSKSLATFNWIITSSSSSSSSSKYQISSTENPFSISFKNADLELLDEGQERERYRFQLSETKTVSPESSLTEDNAAVECDFEATSLQASLYTKMARGYPDVGKGEPDGSPSYPVWPFAVRVEQAVGGGQNTPSCHKISNGKPGDQVTEGLEATDPSGLCSCLYKNWRTPTP